jgi:O-antigen ligase
MAGLLWRQMRRWVLAAGGTALIGLPTVLAFFSGGFFDKPRLISAVVVWCLVVLAAVLAPQPLPASTPGRFALIGLLLLTAWSAVSFAWAPIGGRALDDVQRLALYLGFMVAAIALLRGPGMRRLLEPALALGAFVVVAYGLSERVLPQAIDLANSGSAIGRLEQPLTYWNAMGIVAAVGTVLALRIAGTPTREQPLRVAAAFVAVPMALGVYLTYARGALAALGVGVLVLLALAPTVRPQLRAIVTVGIAATAAVLVANDLPTVKSLSERDSGDGLLMAAVLVGLSVAAAAIAPRKPRLRVPVPTLPVPRSATVLGLSALVLVLGGLAVAALEGKPEGTSPVPGADPARLGSIDTNRYFYWEEAGATFTDHPLVGIGSGGFVVEWLKVRSRADASGDAHSLYFETAAELGLVGVVFLLIFLVSVALAIVRLHRLDAGAATGIAAALSAWAFHAGLDWDWEMPAVSLMALALAAAAIAWSESGAATDRAAPSARAREPAQVA